MEEKTGFYVPGGKRADQGDMIYVTRPSLPPLEELLPSLETIWDNHNLTNRGPFHVEFEAKLAEYLGVKYVSCFTNGMVALQTGLAALGVNSGEVITTPFTFTATPHSVRCMGAQPVFADIDPETFDLDPEKCEALITEKTRAIMPVHVYGTPCRNAEFQKLADKHHLKLIYDAAHAFGVREAGQPVLEWGDISMVSFHATKVFNTFEGGALVTRDPEMKNRIDYLRNFGFENELTVIGVGSNGKMDEFRAAVGLLQLKHIDEQIARRGTIANRYRAALADVTGVSCPEPRPGVTPNYAYFPVLVDRENFHTDRDGLYNELLMHNIYTRRYFYPLCTDFAPYREVAKRSKLPVANAVASQVLCLPIYADLSEEDQQRIIDVIRGIKRA